MDSIPPNVDNTENFDFLKLGQDCEQVAIRVYQTCPDMQLMYPGGVPQMMAMPAALNNQPFSVQKQVLQMKMDMFNQMLKTFEASKTGSGSSAASSLPDTAPQSGSASSLPDIESTKPGRNGNKIIVVYYEDSTRQTYDSHNATDMHDLRYDQTNEKLETHQWNICHHLLGD